MYSWSRSRLRGSLARTAKSVPGLDEMLGRISPLHRRRRRRFRTLQRELTQRMVSLPVPTWALHTVGQGGDGSGTGWAILEEDSRYDSISITANGKPVHGLRRGLEHPSAPRARSGRPVGFSFDVSSDLLDSATWTYPVEFALHDGSEKLDRLSYFFPGSAGMLPPSANRIRVSGNDDLGAYLLEGFTAFVALERVFRTYTGHSLLRAGSVVDWGVGCARFARYFEPHVGPDLSVVGVDVDPVNIGWCQDNASWMRAEVCGPRPPLPLETASANVVIGLSVFTHLRPDVENIWLAEIRRVLRPGGIALLTTLGDANFARSGLGADFYGQLQREGILDVGYNDGIGAVAGDEHYYRNVFHTSAHVRTAWSRHFELIGEEPALIGNHQDVYVLKA